MQERFTGSVRLERAPFRGMSRLIGLRDAPRVDLSWQRDRRLDRETRAIKCERSPANWRAARALLIHPITYGGPVECDEWSHAWRSDVEAAIQALQAASGELQRAAEAAAPLLHLSSSGWSEEGSGEHLLRRQGAVGVARATGGAGGGARLGCLERVGELLVGAWPPA